MNLSEKYDAKAAGLSIGQYCPPRCFELAGKDGVYLPAKAHLAEDRKTVLLKADGLTAPAFVRYLWTNYPEKVSLYGNNGLPALPFRTDSQTGADARTGGIQQVMEL